MSSALCLCVIILIIIIVVVFFASRKESFTNFTTLATPLTMSIVDDLNRSFKLIYKYSDAFNASTKMSDKPAAVAGLKSITANLVNVFNVTKIKRTPPSYANFAALYNGLVCNDKLLSNAADAYRRAGNFLGECEYKDLLYLISKEICKVRRNIHKLGASLDME